MSIRDVVLRLTLQNNLTASATSASRAITSLADAGVAARRQLLGLADGMGAVATVLRGPARNSMQDLSAQMTSLATSAQGMPSARIRELGEQIRQLAPQMGTVAPVFDRIALRVDSFAGKMAKLEVAGKSATSSMRQGFLRLADVTQAQSFAPEEKAITNIRAHMEQLGNSTQILSSSQLAGLGQRMQQLAPQMGAAAPAIQNISRQLLGMASSMKMAEHSAKTLDAAMQGSVMAKTPRVAKMLAVTQSAAQGMLLASSMARPNIMGLAMSLVFLQFSVVKVALAFTALGLAIFGAVGLIKGMIQGGAAAEQFRMRLDYLAKSAEDAGKFLRYSGDMAIKWGQARTEIRGAMETLGRAKLLGTNTMQVIADVAAATGDKIDSVATALESAVEGNFTALKKYGIPTLVDKYGRALYSFQQLLDKLQSRFAGAAERQGKTLIGLGNSVREAFGITMERLGESFNIGLRPVIELLYIFITAIMDTVTSIVQSEPFAEEFAKTFRDIQGAAKKAIPYVQYMGRIIGVLLVGALQLFLRLIKPTIDALMSFARAAKIVWSALMDFLQQVKDWASQILEYLKVDWDKLTKDINWATAIAAAGLLALGAVIKWRGIIFRALGRAITAVALVELTLELWKPIDVIIKDILGEDLGGKISNALRDGVAAGLAAYALTRNPVLAINVGVAVTLGELVFHNFDEIFNEEKFKKNESILTRVFGFKNREEMYTAWDKTVGGWIKAIGDALGAAGTFIGPILGTIGKNIGDAFGGVGEVIGTALGNAGRTIEAWISNVVQWFQDLPKNIGDLLGRFGGWIGDRLGDIGTAMGNKLGEWRDNFVTWLTNLPGNLRTLFISLLNTFAYWLGFATGIGQVVLEKLGEWKDKFIEWIIKLPGDIKSKWDEFSDNLGTWMTTKGTDISTNLGIWKDNFVTWITNLPGNIAQGFTDLWSGAQGVGTWLSDKVASLVAKLTEWKDKFIAWIIALPGNIAQGLRDLWSGPAGLGTWLTARVLDLAAKLLSWRNAFVAWVVNLPSAIEQGLRDLWSGVQGLGTWLTAQVTNISSKLTEWTQAFADWVTNLPVNIWRLATTAASNLLQLGKDIGGKIVDGIKEILSGLDIFGWFRSGIEAGRAWAGQQGGGGGGEVPGAASGGIAMRPTLAMVGEGGEPEAIIPFSKMGGLGGPTVIINAQGSQFLSRRGMNEFADSVFEAAARKLTGPRRLSLQTIS